METLCGFEVTSTDVSRAVALLDEELAAWRRRSLGEIEYLLVDARYEKVRVGGSVVIYLAALRNVPQQLHEAAMLDGAGPVRRFFSITVPMISGAIFFGVVTHTISALQMFDQAYTMFYGPQQKASASDSSLVYMVYLFQNAFQFFRMGFASAMAWVLFLIILVITAAQIRLGNRFVYYEGADR